MKSRLSSLFVLLTLFALPLSATEAALEQAAPEGVSSAVNEEAAVEEPLAEAPESEAAPLAEDAANAADAGQVPAESEEEGEAVTAPDEAPAEEQVKTWTRKTPPPAEDGMTNIVVVPIREAIGKTNLYILRRALKEAISENAEVVVLEMDTPGGRADIMLEMMEMVDRYEGRTIAYINKEAMSAGALISAAADDIYFAPKSVIGAAAVINGDGTDLEPTLKAKIDSYMDAKLRTLTEEHPRRADVIRAMMQTEYVLELDGVTIKAEGPLLSLTDKEAMKLYGDPAAPLLGSGIHSSVDELAKDEYGAGKYAIQRFETSWSESASMFMEKIAPMLMGLGILCLIIGFYVPGFGLPEMTGIGLLVIVFLSNYIAGLAGHEPMIFFAIGFLLLLLELLLFPGVLFMAITGLLLMFGSLVWSLADVWPKSGGGFELDLGAIGHAFAQVSLGVLIAAIGFGILYRFMPKSWIVNRLVLQGSAGTIPVEAAGAVAEKAADLPAIGSIGKTASNLRPGGTVEIEGRFYEAMLPVGSAERGESVRVIAYKDLVLLVEKL